MSTIINASTSSGLVQTADTSGTLVLQSNGTTMQTIDSTGSYGQLKQGTAQASTSGTSIDFTSIPSWVKRITVMFNGVSGNGTSPHLVQIGTGGTPTTTGYISSAGASGNTAQTTSTAGFVQQYTNTAAQTWQGMVIITLLSSNTWVSQGQLASSINNTNAAGGVSLSGALDMIRVTTVNGTDTFDAGSINILYEG